jgi:hypothetical protein
LLLAEKLVWRLRLISYHPFLLVFCLNSFQFELYNKIQAWIPSVTIWSMSCLHIHKLHNPDSDGFAKRTYFLK